MSDPGLPTAAEMIDAFVHPPRIVVVGERRDLGNDRLMIVSHVELWPWRVVVRGAMANRGPTTIDPMDHDASRADFRAHAACMSGWSVIDDVGTDYVSAAAGSSGRGSDIWADFHVEFHPPAPLGANVLTVRSPEGAEFTARLSETA